MCLVCVCILTLTAMTFALKKKNDFGRALQLTTKNVKFRISAKPLKLMQI